MNNRRHHKTLEVLGDGLEETADHLATLIERSDELSELLESFFPKPDAKIRQLMAKAKKMRISIVQSEQLMRTVSALAAEASRPRREP